MSLPVINWGLSCALGIYICPVSSPNIVYVLEAEEEGEKTKIISAEVVSPNHSIFLEFCQLLLFSACSILFYHHHLTIYTAHLSSITNTIPFFFLASAYSLQNLELLFYLIFSMFFMYHWVLSTYYIDKLCFFQGHWNLPYLMLSSFFYGLFGKLHACSRDNWFPNRNPVTVV